MIAVASAKPEQVCELAKAKGWSLPLFSAGDSSFSRDMGVSFAPDQPKEGKYNFGRSWPFGSEVCGLYSYYSLG